MVKKISDRIPQLGPIIQLRDKIKQKLSNQGTTIDTDHLLIEIFVELDLIVKGETEQNTNEEQPRIANANKKGA